MQNVRKKQKSTKGRQQGVVLPAQLASLIHGEAQQDTTEEEKDIECPVAEEEEKSLNNIVSASQNRHVKVCAPWISQRMGHFDV